jgi:putative SOS response-associated peptidase YedK
MHAMCGRYILTRDARELGRVFGAAVQPALKPRYNIAPSQPVPAVRVDRDTGRRTVDLLRWGLVPRWADDSSIGYRMINARAETAATKPAYRSAMKYRRCLVPADAFYEWQKTPSGRKQPYAIQMADGAPFAFAGLWEHWQDAHGNELETCTILTTDANALLAKLHDRMPVILAPEQYDAWLDPANQDAKSLTPMLKPYPAELMIDYPVSTRVNSPKYDDAKCIEPIEGEQGTLAFGDDG